MQSKRNIVKMVLRHILTVFSLPISTIIIIKKFTFFTISKFKYTKILFLISRSCLNITSDHEKVNLADLLNIIETSGGWHLTGTFNPQIDLNQRVQILQNRFGVDVFFTWGVIEQEGQNKIALVAGGWNDVLLGKVSKIQSRTSL